MTSRTCAHHSAQPAIAICSACREDICARCHRATFTGYAICTSCEHLIRAAILTEWEVARTPREFLSAFGSTTMRMLFNARGFFAQLAPVGGWVRPAAFGIAAHVIGMSAQFLWGWLFLPEFGEMTAEAAANTGLSTELATALLFVAVPFVAPIVFATHVALLWLALRVFGADAHWRLVTRIAGYASAAHLLQIIPPIGDFPLGYVLAIIWLVNIELIGVRRYFEEIGVWRAMGAVFLPFLAMSLLGI